MAGAAPAPSCRRTSTVDTGSLTVCEPKGDASPSGTTGGRANVEPTNVGLGGLAIGPGIRVRWGTVMVLVALVPAVVAGRPLTSA